MAELKMETLTASIQEVVKAVGEVEEQIENKGISIRFSADFCNSIVKAMKSIPALSKYSDAVLKLSLAPYLKSDAENNIAEIFKVIRG